VLISIAVMSAGNFSLAIAIVGRYRSGAASIPVSSDPEALEGTATLNNSTVAVLPYIRLDKNQFTAAVGMVV